MPGPMGEAARRMFGGQEDDEIFGGQGNDALGWLRKPKLGVDYGTGKPYGMADQGDAATAYPGQGGSGYPVGSEAARMQKPPPRQRMGREAPEPVDWGTRQLTPDAAKNQAIASQYNQWLKVYRQNPNNPAARSFFMNLDADGRLLPPQGPMP